MCVSTRDINPQVIDREKIIYDDFNILIDISAG